MWLTELLAAFGITADKYPFLVLAILIVAGVVYLRYSLGQINKTIEKMKLNIKAIVSFLATSSPKKFNPSIIESMSPLNIKEQGYQMLKESGFETIMANSESRQKILGAILEQNPSTKLDVEKNAIVLFNAVLENDFMNPVKVYLYNNPDARDVFPTLGGLYIRDEFLKEHPEITE